MSDSTIRPFLFEGEITVRVINRDGLPWFVAADVCRALGIKNPSDALGALDDDEKGIASTYTLGGAQDALVVSESGLFTMILRCRDAIKPGTAPHRFRKWVTGIVLPSLRMTGRYQIPIEAPAPTLPEISKVRIVREARQVFGSRAAGELWFTLGLPTVSAMKLAPAQSDLFLTWTPPTGNRGEVTHTP